MKQPACLAACALALAAFAQEQPADYMVIDLTPDAARRVEFYPSAEALPGGLTSNNVYRTTKMVFRKIRAKGVPWTMGPFADGFVRHVTLDSDYYIGVFEVTQGQAAMVGGTRHAGEYLIDGDLRPVTASSFLDIRDGMSGSRGKSPYPAPPAAESLIGRFRERSGGCKLDLPSEAQWEYACRSGYGNDRWNNGALISMANLDANLPGRYAWNTRHPGQSKGDAPPSEDRTAIVGSYPPNAWGIYDMHGNVNEFCLDWWSEDVDAVSPGGTYAGKVNANGNCHANGTAVEKTWRVTRGGAFNSAASSCLSWVRNKDAVNHCSAAIGFRLVCAVDP